MFHMMRQRPGRRATAWLAVVLSLMGLLALISCADADLETPPPAQVAPLNDKLSLTGEFCTDVPNPVDFPVRILFVVDTSQSMNISDPTVTDCGMSVCLSRRGQSVEDIVNQYPPGDGVEYGLISFNTQASILTKDATGVDGFTADPNDVLTKLPSFAVASGQTDFSAALAESYQMLQTDMAKLDTTSLGRARYIVVFMSDGLPDPRTSDEALPMDVRTDIGNIVGLQTVEELGEISFNTVYINGPGTPLSIQSVASELLGQMANLGNGAFREFDPGQSINLFYLDFRSFLRTYALKTFYVFNSSEKSLPKAVVGVDTDGDGLTDDAEILDGTSPTSADTDGDGFSDFLEVRLRNSGFDPLFADDGDCSQPNDRNDDDGDGLLNCEERFLGTSLDLLDTDADGFSDDTELRTGTNPVVADSVTDTDFDGARNGVEMTWHTDPSFDDSSYFSEIGYRYNLTQVTVDSGAPGRTCYQFTVDNITLAPTGTMAGMTQGTNSIVLRVDSAPSDNLKDVGSHQVACVRPWYRSTPDIKAPLSGQMNVPLTAFKTTGVPAGSEVFDATRDCILP